MESTVNFVNVPGEDAHTNDVMVFKTRVNSAWQHYLGKIGHDGAALHVAAGHRSPLPVVENSTSKPTPKNQDNDSTNVPLEKRAEVYQSQEPQYTVEQLIVADDVKQQLLLAAKITQLESRVFDDWGLRKIEPFPRSALNFYGEPGTGKTLAAHAIAAYLGCKILLVSYAQIESMYHGEGPKNVEAVFYAAQRDNAILFLDEADSLLSKRLTNVTQGSEQAINSMRSQLLICLEKFKGIVIFATNLVKNYDQAFETRVRNIHFPMPDLDCRRKIWMVHLLPQLPQASDIQIDELAVEELCGREIRNAVIEAALQAAMNDAEHVSRQDLLGSIKRVKQSRIRSEDDTVVHSLSEEEQAAVERVLREQEREAQNHLK